MKKLAKVLLPLLVLVLVGTGVKISLDSRKEAGFKEVQIVVNAEDTNILDETVKGDYEIVSDVLTDLEKSGKLNILLEGEKDSEYGRFIVGINNFKTEDMATGPWWVYESPNNRLVLESGFPEGIDLQPVFDGDIFIFNFTN